MKLSSIIGKWFLVWVVGALVLGFGIGMTNRCTEYTPYLERCKLNNANTRYLTSIALSLFVMYKLEEDLLNSK